MPGDPVNRPIVLRVWFCMDSRATCLRPISVLSAILCLLVALSRAPTLANDDPLSGWYSIRVSDSYVGYSVVKLGMIPSRGQFSRVDGEIYLDNEKPGRSLARISVPVSSLESGNKRRTEVLLSRDFFDAERYPVLRFESRNVSRMDNRWYVEGDLTIRGITRPITCDVDVTSAIGMEGPVAVYSLQFPIKRRDFGVLGEKWSGGRLLIADEVTIEITLTAERHGTQLSSRN